MIGKSWEVVFLKIHELNGLYLGTDDPGLAEDAALSFIFPMGNPLNPWESMGSVLWREN